MSPSRSVTDPDSCKSVVDLTSSASSDEGNNVADDVGAAVTLAATTGKRGREPDGGSSSCHVHTSDNRSVKKGSCDSRVPAAAQLAPKHETFNPCMPFLATGDVPDNAIVTDAMTPLLHNLNRIPGVTTLSERTSLAHIEQLDRWSCGFRNTQMMLTALLPHLQSHHAFHQSMPSSLKPYPLQDRHSSRPIPIPSLHQLQSFLQESWANGFDPKGAQHYRHTIVGKRTEIGAMEVATLLSYLYVDTAVVQFIKCRESRALLGPWICSYFRKANRQHQRGLPCSARDPFPQINSMSCHAWANRLLDASSKTGSSNCETTTAINQCSLPILPLYLQWQGHSVTVVGVETTSKTNGAVDMLVFDPMKSGRELKRALSCSTPKTVPDLMRVSCNSLLKQNVDCQVLMCSPRPLTDRERNAFRECSSVTVATAAIDAVRRGS